MTLLAKSRSAARRVRPIARYSAAAESRREACARAHSLMTS